MHPSCGLKKKIKAKDKVSMRNTLKSAEAGGCTAKNISAGSKRVDDKGKQLKVNGTDNNKPGNVQTTDRDKSTSVPAKKTSNKKEVTKGMSKAHRCSARRSEVKANNVTGQRILQNGLTKDRKRKRIDQ